MKKLKKVELTKKELREYNRMRKDEERWAAKMMDIVGRNQMKAAFEKCFK